MTVAQLKLDMEVLQLALLASGVLVSALLLWVLDLQRTVRLYEDVLRRIADRSDDG